MTFIPLQSTIVLDTQDFQRLRIIDQVRSLIKLTYRTTASFPLEEKFGMTAQMRKAAVSIGSNLAEGCGRSSIAASRVCLDRASGEGSELEFQCIASRDLALGKRAEVDELTDATIRTRKMLTSLIVAVRERYPGDDEGRPRLRRGP